jgi:DNA helicase II / ATP-dependent DNA helicase PcrA
MDKILQGLNENQLLAVSSLTGSTLVIAGAGSGKTSALTRRLGYLIAKGCQPGKILCLTFTNKAAIEMNSRVRTLLDGIGMPLPFVPAWQANYNTAPLLCTFHSLGVRLLREFGHFIDLKKEFSILDTDEQKKIIKKILKELNVSEKNLQPSLALYFISQCKQELLLAKDSRNLKQDFLAIFHTIYRRYEEELIKSHNLDFDDLILRTYHLLAGHEEVRNVVNQRWLHIMVDEFQDTNPAQFEIIKLLAPKTEVLAITQSQDLNLARSLFVVGDDAQSIYAFRGSKIEIILNFEKEYNGTTEIILNQNYRSVQPILDLAEKVIHQNRGQKKKDLFTENTEKLDVHYYLASNEKDEASYILKTLNKLYIQNASADIATEKEENQTAFIPDDLGDDDSSYEKLSSNDPVSNMFDLYLDADGFSPGPLAASSNWNSGFVDFSKINWYKQEKLNEVAVLYRTHSQSRAIEEIFLQNNVPYKLVSGLRFLDRREIKDTLALLKYIANPQDTISLSRFLPLVLTGVGPKTLSKMLAFLDDPMYPLPPKYQNQLNEFLDKIKRTLVNEISLIQLTKEILVNIGYIRYLKDQFPNKEEFQSRVDNISELYSIMFPFDEDKNLPIAERLNQFLGQIMLMTTAEMDQEENTPKVSLMSLHQSKGLEFETVFLVGVEDGLLPHSNSFLEPKGVEEEVRLAYVGVTRAKKHLYLISADSRIQFGQIKSNPMSRIFRPFIDTIIKRDH